LLFAAPAPSQRADTGEIVRTAREGVLGTSSELVVRAADAGAAAAAEAAVYAEVERLAAILGTWDERSELARLQRAGSGTPSPELAAVLELAQRWRELSGGAFDPGVARLTQLWQKAAADGSAPAADALQAAIEDLRQPCWQLGSGTLTVRGPLSLDAIAKGWIVERAAAAVATVPGASLQRFQIGGDLRLGATTTAIAIADPRAPAANQQPLCTLQLADRAVASSGGYARGFDVGGRHHSHVLDPRTGLPCDGVLGASVVAADAATADALATLMCVLGPTDGFVLLAEVADAHAVVVTADGVVHTSAGFRTLPGGDIPAAAAVVDGDDAKFWPNGFALQIDFEIKAPASGSGRGRGGWKRPYVAVWIEDLTGAPARTLCLWIENRRWLRDLRRWSRLHTEMPELTDAISQATRKAGNYTLVWDGKDDEGRQLAAGRYTVCIEVAREHGTYQLVRRELELRRTAHSIAIDGNDELAGGKLTFGAVSRSSGR
jgi:thiamine biosynthesis lipoprotein ApbE